MVDSSAHNPPYTAMFHNRYLLVLIIIIVLVGGLSALINLPRLEDPRITLRNPTVITFFPGASSERVESLVTKPIEDELRELYEIKEIESTSRDGASVIAIELQDWTDASNNEQIFSKIRDRLDDAARTFPPGVLPPDFDDKRGASAFTLIVAISAQQDQTDQLGILNRLAEELADRLRNVTGTEIVRLYGEPQEEITVEVAEDQLSALGLNNAQLAQLIASADSKNAAGALRAEGRSVFIEVEGELETLNRIASIPVGQTQTGGILYLGDIANITKSIQDPPIEIAFTDADNRSIFVAARMTDKLRVDHWTVSANAVLTQFEEEFGPSADIQTIFEQNAYTNQRLGELSFNLAMGVMVVMLVVLVSMGWKPSLIVGLALPLAMAGAVFSLSFFGEEIHQMSIFGMIIAIGLLIDNAIVMTDEVRKNIRKRQMTPVMALSKAVAHLKIPLFASTLTTILGFMPVFLLPGNIGDFVSPIAISVVMALVFSFFLSLTVIATLAAIFTKKKASGPQSWWRSGVHNKVLDGRYRHLLRGALLKPRRAVAIALILPVIGFGLASQLPNVFFPSADRDHFEVQVWMPEDASIARTSALVRDIALVIRAQDHTERTHWLVGGSTPSVYYNQIKNKDNYAAYAQGIVFAESAPKANRLIPQLQNILDERFPEARIIVRAFAQGPPVSSPVAFRVVGTNAQTLRVLGERVRLELEQHPDVTHSFASMEGGKQKFWLEADEDKARLAGLTLNDVAMQFQAQLEGMTGGTVLEDLEELPVRVRAPNETRSDLARIASLRINSPVLDDWIPASALGDIVLKPETTVITRRDGERINQVEAFLHPGAAPISVARDVQKALGEEGFALPAGYRLEVAGDADAQKEALGLLMTYLPVLLVLMVSTLILSFKSVALAGVIGAVAALSGGLGFLSLAISGFPIGFNPLIGTAGLVGVAINGSIVVLAAIRANPNASAGDIDEILHETMGCARHILSTTFTTVAGFMPLLISGGTFWPPLAIVIAGGVGFSVILSLYFTPAVYALISRAKEEKIVELQGVPA